VVVVNQGLEAVDAVVVGGGIVGASTALQLQRTGRKILLVERGAPADEASGHNGGMFSDDCLPTGLPHVIRSLPHLLRDPESPLVLRLRYLPRLAPWLVRFALNSRPTRVEAISKACTA
jgi:D-amino-acid dehydrogenase